MLQRGALFALAKLPYCKKKTPLPLFECPSSLKISEKFYEQILRNICIFVFGSKMSHSPQFENTNFP